LRSFPTALHAPLTLERLWRHAVETARLAKAFARAGGMQGEEVESAFTAGLLHDIGRLVLAEAHGENYFVTLRSSRDDGVPMLICERGTYDCDHADVGGSMLRFWNLPKAVAEAVRWHHEPSRSYAGFSLAMAVHLADVLAHAKPGIAAYTPGVLDEVHTAACGLPVELGALERLAQDAER
jgi:putative nucleotidyltransferase with HDIG domain